MAEECPYCDVKMVERVRKDFGNPIKADLPIEECPKCGFSSVSEENLGIIKQAMRS